MEFNLELDTAIRNAFAASGVRIAPEAKTSEIAAKLTEYQMTPTVDGGLLAITQHGAPISVGTALAAFVAKHPENFILPGGQVRSLADLRPADTDEGRKQRVELIRAKGLDEFNRIVNAPNLRSGVVANREMNKADWKNLTTREKSAAIAADPEIVSIIHSRK